MLWQDYGALLRTHRENNADITIATHSVGWKQASLRGITRVDPDGDHPLPALNGSTKKFHQNSRTTHSIWPSALNSKQ